MTSDQGPQRKKTEAQGHLQRGNGYAETEAEIGVMQLQAQVCPGWPPKSWEEKKKSRYAANFGLKHPEIRAFLSLVFQSGHVVQGTTVSPSSTHD